MGKRTGSPWIAIVFMVIGAIVGLFVFLLIGGIGVALLGTAVGITMGPFVLIGACLFGLLYGVYWLGKQIGSKR